MRRKPFGAINTKSMVRSPITKLMKVSGIKKEFMSGLIYLFVFSL
jgi:hypothetical protein